MTDKEQTAHYEILQGLYALYIKNPGNAEILDAVAKVSWNLGVNLNYDHAYHELAELAKGSQSGSSEGSEHYIQVVESTLSKLKP